MPPGWASMLACVARTSLVRCVASHMVENFDESIIIQRRKERHSFDPVSMVRDGRLES